MWITSGTLRPVYDCYVVGAGPAGITLALELAKANKKVLLFESGTATDARADMPNAINQGHLPDGWWDKHSIRTLGGTSKVWAGWCITLTERDFDNPAVGVRWPITRPELVPYYRRAAGVLDRDTSIVDVETPPWCPGSSTDRSQEVFLPTSASSISMYWRNPRRFTLRSDPRWLASTPIPRAPRYGR